MQELKLNPPKSFFTINEDSLVDIMNEALKDEIEVITPKLIRTKYVRIGYDPETKMAYVAINDHLGFKAEIESDLILKYVFEQEN